MDRVIRPYRTEMLEWLHDNDQWHRIPVVSIPTRQLIPTQPNVSIERLKHLMAGGLPETHDPHPHFVSHKGKVYVHDGHHRYVLALLGGVPFMNGRLIEEDNESDDDD